MTVTHRGVDDTNRSSSVYIIVFDEDDCETILLCTYNIQCILLLQEFSSC